MTAIEVLGTTTSDQPRSLGFVSTGGTIALSARTSLDFVDYATMGKALSGGEIISRVPELQHLAHITNLPFRRLRGPTISDRDLLDLALFLNGTRDDGFDGIVVAHGTNAIEETAYFLGLTVTLDVPVVLAGSMRPHDSLGSDAGMNLFQAVVAAAAPQTRDLGVLVVMNGGIMAARDVCKRDTIGAASIGTTGVGPLGFVRDDGTVSLYHTPYRRHTTTSDLSIDGLDRLPRVDIVTSHVGASGEAIECAVAAGARGLIVSALGSGAITHSQRTALIGAAEQGTTICIASRTESGAAQKSAEFEPNWVIGDNLSPWKARVLLSLALAHFDDSTDIQRIFDTH